MLNPATDLQALTVEGVRTSEDLTDDKATAWEGVDCALYYGDRTLAGANRVELAQLKYSGSNPTSPWTVARLTANTKRIGNNSVIARMAESFTNAHKFMKPGASLTIRLISNQPISPEFTQLLNSQRSPSPTKTNIGTTLQEVSKATGLIGIELTEFLRAIDTSECGSTSRFAKKETIISFVADVIGDDATSLVRVLQMNVRDLMLPERARDIITFEIVLGWFGIASRHGLFPAVGDFKPVQNAILRKPATRVSEAVIEGSRITLLHGPAGCGKTTTIGQVEKLLPPGSAFVLFDCYGAGRYVRTNDRRHLPQNAFSEIANELSLKLGIPFFLAATPNSANVLHFLAHIQRAGEALAKSQPDALITIAIDAADNSVSAATRANPPEKCFVHELTQADLSKLPTNVRFIFSARSARKDSLSLPTGTPQIECPPFEPTETRAFVLAKFPDVLDDWIDQFHHLSGGIPRVQDYAFSAGAGDKAATMNALRPGGKVVSDVLRQLFERALTRAGRLDAYSDFVSALAALPAPVPQRHLAAISGFSESEALDLVNDLQPSLRPEPEGISISDEDVEDFIQGEAANNLVTISRACAPTFLRDLSNQLLCRDALCRLIGPDGASLRNLGYP